MYSFVVIQIGGTICSVWTQHLVHEALESIRGSEQAKRKCDNYFIVNYIELFASYAQVTPRAVNAPSRQAAYQNGAHQRSGFCHDPSEWWVYLWGFQCFFLGHPGSPSGHVPVTRTSNLHWRSCGSWLVRHNVCSRRDLWRNANGNALMSAHALESPSRSWNGPAPEPWQAGWKVHWTHTWVCGKPRDDLLQPTTEENCLLQT